jgi:hypothetical protein
MHIQAIKKQPVQHCIVLVHTHATHVCASPAPMAACRAGACPTPAWQTLPMIASWSHENVSLHEHSAFGLFMKRDADGCLCSPREYWNTCRPKIENYFDCRETCSLPAHIQGVCLLFPRQQQPRETQVEEPSGMLIFHQSCIESRSNDNHADVIVRSDRMPSFFWVCMSGVSNCKI